VVKAPKEVPLPLEGLTIAYVYHWGALASREEDGYALAAAVCSQLTDKGSLELRTGYRMAHMEKSSVYTCKENLVFICRLLGLNRF
jgi:hypothetical protein